jgi:hypothetical protein
MAEPVVISLQAHGVTEIKQALRSVSDALVKMERDGSRAAQAGSRDRVRIVKNEGEARTRAVKAGATAEERAAKAVAKATERAEKDKTRAKDRELKAQQRSVETAARNEVRAAERAAREQSRIQQRAERERTREAERWARQRERIHTNSAIYSARITERETRAQAASRAKYTQAIGSSVGGTISKAAAIGSGMLAVGAGFGIADVASRSLQAEQSAVLLSNSAYNPMEAGSKRYAPGDLIGKAAGVERGTNVDRVNVLGAMRDYIALSSDTRMLDGKDTSAMELTKIAKATGSEVGDVFKMAGNLRVQNKDMDSATMMNLVRSVIGQGKAGATELNELAQYGAEATSTSGMYQGSQADNQRRLLGLTQVARRVAGTAESVTSVRKLESDVSTHKGKINAALAAEGLGAITDKQGLLAAPSKILSSLFQVTGGDTEKLQKLGINERSVKHFNALAPTYRNAYDAAKGSDKEKRAAGASAVRAEVEKYENASYSKEDVEKDFSEVMKTSSERFSQAINTAKDAIETQLTPFLTKFANYVGDPKFQESVTKLVNGLGEVAGGVFDFASKHPFEAIGLMISKDIAAAGIGQLAGKALSGALGGPGMAIAVGTMALTVGMATIDVLSEKAAKKNRGDNEAVIAAGNARGELNAALRGGNATPEMLKNAKDRRAALQKVIDDDLKRANAGKAPEFTVGGLVSGSYMGGALASAVHGAVRNATGEAANDARKLRTEEESAKALDDIIDAIAKKLADGSTAPTAANRNVPQVDKVRGGPA